MIISQISILNSKKKTLRYSDYSIEYCHIYADQQLNAEHKKSIDLKQRIEKLLQKQGKTYSTLVLIDNYNAKTEEMSKAALISQLKDWAADPEYIFYEKDLLLYMPEALQLLHPKSHREYIKYIEKWDGFIPCSLFIILWYFLRLGIIQDHKSMVSHKEASPPQIYAKNLITILPKYYEPLERIAMRHIEKSKYSFIKQHIFTVFF